jgi:cytochrome o ubiquinol oxidase subunit II
MNGMATQLYLRADEPGTYLGLSGHFSGDGFSDMNFPVRALPPDQFDAWVKATRASGEALDTRRYVALARQSVERTPLHFAVADAELFDKIVRQVIAPGPGPELERPGAKER